METLFIRLQTTQTRLKTIEIFTHPTNQLRIYHAWFTAIQVLQVIHVSLWKINFSNLQNHQTQTLIRRNINIYMLPVRASIIVWCICYKKRLCFKKTGAFITLYTILGFYNPLVAVGYCVISKFLTWCSCHEKGSSLLKYSIKFEFVSVDSFVYLFPVIFRGFFNPKPDAFVQSPGIMLH